jgi:hypothetical protein
LKELQERNGLGRLRGRSEDGAAVVLQQLEPLRQVLRMIGARILRDTMRPVGRSLRAARSGAADLGVVTNGLVLIGAGLSVGLIPTVGDVDDLVCLEVGLIGR